MYADKRFEIDTPIVPAPDLTYAGVALRDFIGWLETKPARKRYEYTDPRNCAIGQYKQARGLPDVAVLFSPFTTGWHHCEWLWNIVASHPRTFGAALDRARKVLAEQP